MSDAAAAIAAGWYQDPNDAAQLRWWDGSAWTEHQTPVPQPEPQPVVAAAPAPVAAPVYAPPVVQPAYAQPQTYVEPAPAPAPKPSKRGGLNMDLTLTDRSKKMLVVLAAVVLICVVYFVFLKGHSSSDANTTGGVTPESQATPAATPVTPAGGAGTAVPTQVDKATGGAVTKAKRLAAKANAAAAATDAAG